MKQYLDLLRHVRDTGVRKKSRPVLKSTGTSPDTFSVFGYQMRFDLAEGFPAVTTKKLQFEAVVHELLWFLRGDTNVAYLRERGVRIWDGWADPATGDCGPIYSAQWRRWDGKRRGEIDQIAEVVRGIRSSPDSRRLVVSAWNPDDLPRVGLPWCHAFFQFYVSDGRLSCHLYQRSADVFLGVPFNIASYALLTHMIARVTDLRPGDLIVSFGDVHIYENHLDVVATQLAREPLPPPTLRLDPAVRDLDAFEARHVTLVDYAHRGVLRGEVAV